MLRIAHMQRSILLKLTSVVLYRSCFKGKHGNAFTWVAPRYGLTSFDAGGAMFKHWLQLSQKHGRALRFVIFDEERGGAMKGSSAFASAVCAVLRAAGLAPDDWSSCCLRRVQSTVIDIRGPKAGHYAKMAVGDWQDSATDEQTKMKLSALPVRYSADRTATALEEQLLQVEILCEALARKDGPVDWPQVRLAHAHVDEDALRKRVRELIATKHVVLETPPSLLPFQLSPKKRLRTPRFRTATVRRAVEELRR